MRWIADFGLDDLDGGMRLRTVPTLKEMMEINKFNRMP
jgi:hypothetical protein